MRLALVVILAFAHAASPPVVPDFPLDTLEPVVEAQFREAVAALEAAPDDGVRQGRLGMLYHAYAMIAHAGPCYERAMELAGADDRWRWAYLLGIVRAEEGKLDESIALFESTVAFAYGPAVWLRLGDAWRERGDADRARGAYEQVVASGANEARGLYGLARLALDAGDAERALALLEEAVTLEPAYGAAYYAGGGAARRLGRRDLSRTLFEQAEQHRDQAPPLRDPAETTLQRLALGAVELMQRGVTALEAGDLENAIALLQQATRVAPDLTEAHSQLGTALLLAGQVGPAETHLREALALNADFVDARYNLGFIAYRRGELDVAIAHFRRGVATRPDHFDVRMGLGLALRRAGDDDGAVVHLEAATALRPGDPRPYRHLEGLYRRRAAWRDAATVLERGLRALPDERSLRQRLAWVLATAPDAGVRDPQRALTLVADQPDASARELDTIAAALAASERYDEAIRIADRAIRILEASGDAEALEATRARRAGYAEGRSHRMEPEQPRRSGRNDVP